MNTLTDTQVQTVISVLEAYSSDLEEVDNDLIVRIKLIINKLTRTS